jgi:hypothetical protein
LLLEFVVLAKRENLEESDKNPNFFFLSAGVLTNFSFPFVLRMDQLPPLRRFCEVSLPLICDHLEDCVSISTSSLVGLQSVLAPSDWKNVVEERFAQSKCGSCLCDALVDKEKNSQTVLRFAEKSGELLDVSEYTEFCSLECVSQSKTYVNSLDPTPVYLRVEPVQKVISAAKVLNLSDEKMNRILTAAGPLLPKSMVIVEEAEVEEHCAAPTVEAMDLDDSEASSNVDEGVDIMGLMELDEEEKDSTVVGIPLIPLIWDMLGQYCTPQTKRFVASGCVPLDGITMVEDTTSVGDLKNNSQRKRQMYFSQMVGPKVRTLLLESEAEDATLVVGLVDDLILTLNITQDSMLSDKRKMNYASAASLFSSSASLRIVAAVLISVCKPDLYKKVTQEVPKIQPHEWELLMDVFK